jgi:hypothetical protein
VCTVGFAADDQLVAAAKGHHRYDETRIALVAAMTEAVERAGAAVSPEFPLVSKIVELRSIGQHHLLV